MSKLREQVIKLAYQKEHLRPHLLPLIKTVDPSKYFDAKCARGSWGIDVSKTPLDQARQYAQQRLNTEGIDLYDVWPDFDQNYQLLRKKLSKALDIPRIQMPVIEPDDMDDFHEALNEGKLDIFRPWAKGEMFAPDRFVSKEDAEAWVEMGLQDGAKGDDPVRAKWSKIPAGDLIPTQGQIWFDKLVEGVVDFGPIESGSPVLSKTIIVSKEGYILDGHHRFSGTLLSDPSLQMDALFIPLGIDRLLEIGRAYGAAQGNEPKA